jgi:hypothetical protein
MSHSSLDVSALSSVTFGGTASSSSLWRLKETGWVFTSSGKENRGYVIFIFNNILRQEDCET